MAVFHTGEQTVLTIFQVLGFHDNLSHHISNLKTLGSSLLIDPDCVGHAYWKRRGAAKGRHDLFEFCVK
jgi:hypothetical protein